MRILEHGKTAMHGARQRKPNGGRHRVLEEGIARAPGAELTRLSSFMQDTGKSRSWVSRHMGERPNGEQCLRIKDIAMSIQVYKIKGAYYLARKKAKKATELLKKQENDMLTLAQAAPILNMNLNNLKWLARTGDGRTVAIPMPDGSKELLRLKNISRKHLYAAVNAEDARALAEKMAAMRRSVVRLTDAAKQTGIHYKTLRSFFVRERGELYVAINGTDEKRRFAVHENHNSAKYISLEDMREIKHLFSRRRRKIAFEELAKNFMPSKSYYVSEAAQLTGFREDTLCEMIKRGDIKAEKRGRVWIVQGAAIANHFANHRRAPGDAVSMAKAAKILERDYEWIKKRLKKQGGEEILEYKTSGVGFSIPVYRKTKFRLFSSADLAGLRLIDGKISFGHYLESHSKKHGKKRAAALYARLLGSVRKNNNASICGHLAEECAYKAIKQYSDSELKVPVIKINNTLFVRPEDARLIVLSLMLQGSEKERHLAISRLEMMKAIPEEYYWLARGAFMSSFGPITKRIEAILSRYSMQHASAEAQESARSGNGRFRG